MEITQAIFGLFTILFFFFALLNLYDLIDDMTN